MFKILFMLLVFLMSCNNNDNHKATNPILLKPLINNNNPKDTSTILNSNRKNTLLKLPTDNEDVLINPRESPRFIGNYEQFISLNLKYPEQAFKKNIKGRVVVEYVIKKDSSIAAVKVLKGLGYGCDEEAIRFVKSTNKKWTQGKFNGNPIDWKGIISILFEPDDKNIGGGY